MNEVNRLRELPVITRTDLKKCIHWKESSRYGLALFIVAPCLLLALIGTFASFGLVLIYLAMIMFSVWVAMRTAKALFIGGSVEVSRENFPEIFEIVDEVKRVLSCNEEIKIYIIPDGGVNAFMYKFFSSQFIVLTSDTVHGMNEDPKRSQLTWVIARFIGQIQTKSTRLTFIQIVLNSLKKLGFLNLFLFPYERATVLTGDQIGMALSRDLKDVMNGFDRLLIGNNLSEQVDLKGLLMQARNQRISFFNWFSRILITHPHMIDRYINLLSFAKKQYPQKFEVFIENANEETRSLIYQML